MKNLKEILEAIRIKSINYGLNKDYFFILDEDGRLVFLKRKRGEEDSEDQWPSNPYDGETIWSYETYHNRGLGITKEFLRALEIDVL